MKLAALLLACTLLPSPITDAKDEHPWVKAGEGAWTEMKIVHRGEVQMTVRDELVKLADERYFLNTTNTMVDFPEMEPFLVERDYDYAFMGYAHLAPGAEKIGKADVEIAGRPVACEVYRKAWKTEEGDNVSRVWTSPRLREPAQFDFQDGDMQVLLTFTGRYEILRVGERRIRCARYEGVMKNRGIQQSAITQWRSDEVPGGIVRNEAVSKQEGEEVMHSVSLEDFGIPEKKSAAGTRR